MLCETLSSSASMGHAPRRAKVLEALAPKVMASQDVLEARDAGDALLGPAAQPCGLHDNPFYSPYAPV